MSKSLDSSAAEMESDMIRWSEANNSSSRDGGALVCMGSSSSLGRAGKPAVTRCRPIAIRLSSSVYALGFCSRTLPINERAS